MKIEPSYEEFKKRVRRGERRVLFETEFLADCLTPVSLFMGLDSQQQWGFLFESVEGGERLGRYSFIGLEYEKIFKAWGEKIVLELQDAELTLHGDPWGVLGGLLEEEWEKGIKEHPIPFTGGAVGYIGYESVYFLEEHLRPFLNKKREMPDFYFLFVKTLIVFDNIKRTLKLLTNVDVDSKTENLKKEYEETILRLNRIKQKLLEGVKIDLEIPCKDREKRSFKSNFKREDFLKAVRRCKKYIKEGDIFQVVLSQRFSRQTRSSPFSVYRMLRLLNPSPYMFFFKTPELHLIGSSPEILVTLKKGQACVRPIAGTRPRGRTVEEDLRLERDLLADPKERAEHIMLVDLGRNDLSRVCRKVRVEDLMVIERYSHVMHIVSHVVGELKKGHNAVDLLKATFPAGTVSGAPKIRAMEIIAELEPTARGPYAGALGYFSQSGDMDMCITIRTLIQRGKQIEVQAGAGIVADSKPQREYQETINKAMGMLRAVEMAETGEISL